MTTETWTPSHCELCGGLGAAVERRTVGDVMVDEAGHQWIASVARTADVALNFASTGDPEQDEEEARRILRTAHLLSVHRCPNDAQPLALLLEPFAHRECARCGFVEQIAAAVRPGRIG